jgi:hypothetical protein
MYSLSDYNIDDEANSDIFKIGTNSQRIQSSNNKFSDKHAIKEALDEGNDHNKSMEEERLVSLIYEKIKNE